MRAYFKGAIPSSKSFKGQGELIMSVLGTDTSQAKSTATITREIADRLITRQDKERVVAFYMSTWTKKGYVKFIDLSMPEGEVSENRESHDEIFEVEVMPVENSNSIGNLKQFPDLNGKKLSQAIVSVLEFKAKSLAPQEIGDLLKENGFVFKPNQIGLAIANLVRSESIIRVGDKVSLSA